MSSVIKMKGAECWIRDNKAMRTAKFEDAMKFSSKEDAKKSLAGFVQNGKVLQEKWEVKCLTSSSKSKDDCQPDKE